MTIVIDLGGTTTRVGFSTNTNSFDNIVRFDTPDSLANLKQRLADHLANTNADTISMGIAGIVNHQSLNILQSPNIPYLNGIKCTDLLPPTNAELYLNNDTELAALGEYYFGAGQNSTVMAYITLSTGVGGSRVINGNLDPASLNYEPGHMIINKAGTETEKSGLKGTFEAYNSGPSFQKLYGTLPQETEDTTIWLEYSHNLAYGLANVTLMWACDVIVLGGGLSESLSIYPKHFLSNTGSQMEKIMPMGYPKPELRISTLKDTNGLLGGLKRTTGLRKS